MKLFASMLAIKRDNRSNYAFQMTQFGGYWIKMKNTQVLEVQQSYVFTKPLYDICQS